MAASGSERVGTIVYSAQVDSNGEHVSAWAICDHCGATNATVAYHVAEWSNGDIEVVIHRDECGVHECPPVAAPLPASSVCGRRPCGRCLRTA